MVQQSLKKAPDDESELLSLPIVQGMIEVRSKLPTFETSIVTAFPPLTSLAEPAFLGSFSWAGINRRWRIIPRKDIRALFGFQLTPADIARDYIKAKYKRAGRISTAQYHATVKAPRHAPLYAAPQTLERAVYLDLKSAYWSILQIIGWDVDYFPNRFLGVNSTCADFPFWRDKMARNCIVSVGLTGFGKRWTGEKLEFAPKPNPLTNMVLWCAVQDVLNSVAADMVNAGAVYVHTDGYILPADKVRDGFRVLDEWGLIGSIRHEGECKVYAVGTYDIGGHKASRLNPTFGKPFDNIDRRWGGWLRPRFKRFADRVELILY